MEDCSSADEQWLETIWNEGQREPGNEPGPSNDDEQGPSLANSEPAAPADAACWGAQLKALLPADVERTPCDHAFVPGKNHLKNRFCESCKLGLHVPALHVRALTPALAPSFVNGRAGGFWTNGAVHGTMCEYRVVNQTRNTRGAPLVIFAQPPPASLGVAWGELPTEWLSAERPDLVPLAFALGTLEPASSIVNCTGALRRRRDMELAEQQGSVKRPALPDTTAAGSSSGLAAVGRSGSSQSSSGSSGMVEGPSPPPQQGVAMVPPTVEPDVVVPPAIHGASSSHTTTTSSSSSSGLSLTQMGSLLSSPLLSLFMPDRLAIHPPLSEPLPIPPPQPPLATAAATTPEEEADEAAAAATETTGLLPSPPTSPPDQLGAYNRVAQGTNDPILPVALHPLTLRFSPRTAEAAWRAAHAHSLQWPAKAALFPQLIMYLAMGLAEPNAGAQLWLLAWSIGYLPASLLALWCYAYVHNDDKDRAKGSSGPGRAVAVPSRQLAPWVYDWGALSLCVVPQLILTLRTRLFEWDGSSLIWDGSNFNWGSSGGDRGDSNSSGGSCLIDPLDAANGARGFGRVMANWWFAHILLRLNCTDPAILLLAVALSAALFSLQAPITLVPHRERLFVFKGCLGGQVSGYLLERALRCRYLREQHALGAIQREGASAGAAAARSEPAATCANRRWAAHETRMHPLTMHFGSAALEARYRKHVFNDTAKTIIDCLATTDAVHNLVDVLGGQTAPLDSLILTASNAAPIIGRHVLHCRGDRPAEVARFRYSFLAYSLLLFPAKMLWPSAVGLGSGDGVSTTLVEIIAQNFVMVPILLRLYGPRTDLCWILSAVVIALSHVAPALTSHGNQTSDPTAIGECVGASEVLAYALDWGLRAQFLRAIRKDEERPV